MDDNSNSSHAADLLSSDGGGGGGGGGGFNHSAAPAPGQVVIHYPRAATITAAVFCIIFIIVGVIGNVITMVVLRQSLRMPARLSTAATLFLLSLCVSDLLFCAINLPLTASRYINEAWLLGETLCQLFPFFLYGNVAASLFSMVAVAVNRYILICHKHLYGKVYRLRHIAVMVTCIWIVSFGPMLLPLTGAWGRLGLNERIFSCTILAKDGSSPKKALFSVGVLTPCAIITACYLLIYIRAVRHRITTGRSSMPSSHSVQSINRKPLGRQEDRRLTTMMLTVFLAFIVCFLPVMLVNVFDDDPHPFLSVTTAAAALAVEKPGPTSRKHPLFPRASILTIPHRRCPNHVNLPLLMMKAPGLHVMASVLAWTSPVINPFIYAGSSRYYRGICRQLMCAARTPASVSGGGVLYDGDVTVDCTGLQGEAAQARLTDGTA